MIQATERNYFVYRHTLKKDGRIYIGITKQKPEHRWNNGEGYRTGDYHTRFYNAIKKYGWDNFDHEILYDGLTCDEAKAKEIELIEKYHTRDKKHGFNTLKGGDLGGSGVKQSEETIEKRRKKLIGQKRSQETKNKISEWHKNAPKEYRDSLSKSQMGKKLTEKQKKQISEKVKKALQNDDVRKKMSDGNKGKTPWNKGKPFSEEVRKKISERVREAKTPDRYYSKAVMCIETNEVFNSIAEARRKYNIASSSGIVFCCQGKRQTCGNKHWKYYDGAMI